MEGLIELVTRFTTPVAAASSTTSRCGAGRSPFSFLFFLCSDGKQRRLLMEHNKDQRKTKIKHKKTASDCALSFVSFVSRRTGLLNIFRKILDAENTVRGKGTKLLKFRQVVRPCRRVFWSKIFNALRDVECWK